MTPTACLLFFALCCPVEPPPRIDRPVVDVVQRGTAARVFLTGSNLSHATRLAFDNASGLRGEITKRVARRLELTLRVAGDATLGPRELRILTPDGASNAVTLHVVDLPVLQEKEPNNATANPLAIPSLLCGAIHAGAETDRFRFGATQGEGVTFTLATRRIGSTLDPSLTILDDRGRTIAWGRTTSRGDTELRFEPPGSRDYVLVIHDVRFRGGPRFQYHLRAGAPPLEHSVAPSAESPTTGRDRAVQESEPNERSKPQLIEAPLSLRGCISGPRDHDCYRFEIKKAAKLRLSVRSRALRSPLDPLLILQDANGKQLRIDDDSGDGSDARIDFDFKPGRYHAIVRSLVGQGGPDHAYRLTIGPPDKAPRSFEVRFRPDTPVVRRGGRAQLWCELVRGGGFDGPVDLAFADLPPGVTASAITLDMGNGWTSVFTLHASEDARLGSAPLRIDGSGTIAGKTVRRSGIPEAGTATSRRAWLSVLPRGMFTVTSMGPPPKEVRAKWAAERRALQQKLRRPNPALAAELSEFEDAHREETHWLAVRAEQPRSKFGAKLQPQSDGSLLPSGTTPAYDVYSFEFGTDLETIAAVRLDLLPDKSMPTGELGRADGHGNFVLNRFTITTADGKPVKLVRPKARFSQKGFAIANVLDGKSGTGWASAPQTKTANWAIFELQKPLPGNTRLRVTLDQEHGSRHTIGRFRVSVATRRRSAGNPVVPDPVHAILMAARADRPDEDEAMLRAWFRDRSPSAAKIRRRIAEIDAGRGNQVEIAKLSRQLRVFTPAVVAAQKEWEATTAKSLVRWTPLQFTKLRSEKGVRFTREADDVVRVRRPVADQDNYELVAKTGLQQITAVRIETLPTKELSQGGAGLAKSGNFVLTGFSLRAWPATEPAAARSIPLTAPMSSFDQPGYPVRGTLDGNPQSGWGVFPKIAEKHFALWRLQKTVGAKGPTVLRFYLEHMSPNARHQLGRFRIAVTDAKNPSLTERGLPLAVTQALLTPDKKRTAKQRKALQDWYRDIAPELDSVRKRIQLLHAQQSIFPPKVVRGERGRLAVRIQRRAGFHGEVRVSLEGFSSGRENNRAPRAITRNLETTPVILPRGQSVAVIEFKALPKCELGTRAVVIRAVAKQDKDTIVDYSAPIPFTVTK